MAKRLNVSFSISADSSQAKKEIASLRESLNAIGDYKFDISGISEAFGRSTVQIEKASTAAESLQQHLKRATDVKTGNINLSEFNKSIKSSGDSLGTLLTDLREGGKEGNQAFLGLAQSLIKAETPMKNLTGFVGELFVTLKNTLRWQLTSSFLHTLSSSIQTAFYYSKDLNESLNNIRIVTGKGKDEMKDFAAEASKAAKALNTTTLEYTDASLIYFQQGDIDEVVRRKSEITIKAANAAGTSAEAMSEYLTAVWNSYQVGIDELESYVDKMARVGADTASSLEEISTAMTKVAATANTVGVNMDQLTSIIATVASVTRNSAETVGTAFKTIFARTSDLKLGGTDEDAIGLGKVSSILKTVGVDVLDTNNELEDMGSIIEDIGTKWQGWNRETKVAVAEAVAGKRQYTQLMALFENWDMYTATKESAEESAGALDEMADTFGESWQAASNRLQTSLEAVYSEVFNDDVIIVFINLLGEAVELMGDLVDGAGGFGNILLALGGYLTQIFSNQIISGANSLARAFQINFLNAQNYNQATREAVQSNLAEIAGSNDLAAALLSVSQLKSKIVDSNLRLTASQKKELENLADTILARKEEALAIKESIRTQEQASNKILANQRRVSAKTSIETKQQQKPSLVLLPGGETFQQPAAELTPEQKRMSINTERVALEKEATEALKQQWLAINNIQTLEKEQSSTSKKRVADLQEQSQAIQASGGNLSVILAAFDQMEIDTGTLKNSLETIGSHSLNEFRTNSLVILKTFRDMGLPMEELEESLGRTDANAEEILTDFIKLLQNIGQLKSSFNLEGLFGSDPEAAQNIQDMADRGFEILKRKKEELIISDQIKGTEEEIKEILEERTVSFGKSVTALAGATMSLASMINAFKNIKNVWEDEDVSLGEKMLQTLSALAMSAFDLTTIMNALRDAKLLDVIASKIFVSNKIAETGAIVAEGVAANATSKALVLLRGSLGPVLLIAIGTLTALFFAVDALVVSTKEAEEEVSKLRETFEESSSEVEELTSKIDELNSKMNEIREKGPLSITDSAEIANLQAEKEALEAQKKIKEEINKLDAEALVNTTAEYYDKLVLSAADVMGANRPAARQIRAPGYMKTEAYAEEQAQEEGDYAEALQTNLDYYQNYLDAQEAGIIVSEEAMLSAQQKIAELYKAAYGEGDYFANIINPVLDTATVSEYEKQLQDLAVTNTDWATKTSSGMKDVLNDVDENLYNNLQVILDQMGISVQDYMQGLSDQYSRGILGIIAGGSDDEGFKNYLGTLSDEEYQVAVNLQVEGDITLEEFKALVDTAYRNEVLTLTFQTRLDQFDAVASAVKSIMSGEGIEEDLLTELASTIPELADLAEKSLFGQAEALTDYILSGENEMLDAVESLKAAADISLGALFQEESDLVGDFAEELQKIKDEGGKVSLDTEITINGETYSAKEWLEQISQIEDSIQDISGSKAEAEVNVSIIGANALAAQAQAIAQAGELISKDYKVAAENVSALNDIYPELLQRATIFKDGSVQLNSEIVNSFRDSKNQQLALDAETLNAQIENKKVELQADIDMLTLQREMIVKAKSGDDSYKRKVLENFLNYYVKMSASEEYVGLSTAASTSEAWADSLNSIGQNQADVTDQMIDNFKAVAAAGAAAAKSYEAGEDLTEGKDFKTEYTSITVDKTKGSTVDEIASKYQEIIKKRSYDDSSITNAELDTIDAFYSQQIDVLTKQLGSLTTAQSNLLSSLDSAKTSYDKSSESSSDANKKTIKELQEIEDRYHEINQAIEYQESLYNRLSKAVDRAYGQTAIDLLDQEQKALKSLYDLTQQKASLYESYTALDRQSAEMLGATFDSETGLISNYTSLVNSALDKYNEAINTFNAGAQEEADQEVLSEAETTYNDLIDTLDQYETQLNGWLDTLEEISDIYDNLGDIELQKIKITLQVSSEQTDIKADIMNYFSTKYKDSIQNVKAYYETSISLASNYLDELTSIEEAYSILVNSDYLSDSDMVAQLSELISTAAESLTNIQEISDTLKKSFSEALELASKDLSVYTNQIEGCNSALENYVSILNLMGLEGDYDKFTDLLSAQTDVLTNQVQIAKVYYESLLAQKQSLKEDYESGLISEEFYKKNYEAITETITDAYDDYLSKTKDALESLQTMFTNSIKTILQVYEEAMSGSSLSQLQTIYDRYIDKSKDYLTSLEKTYELNKILNDINEDLSKTENTIAIKTLNNLKDEISQLQDKEELSKYELEYLQAKYTATQKQIALEEAQKSKSILKLKRDAEGNYVQVFTADEDSIAEAREEYQSALEDMSSLSAKRVGELEKEYLDSISKYSEDMQSLIEDINNNLASLEADYLSGKIASESEYERLVAEQYARIDELKIFYLDKFARIETQAGIASANLQQDAYNLMLSITGDTEKAKLAANKAIEESSNATLQRLIMNEENWSKAVQEATTSAKQEIQSYQASISELSLATVGDYTDINNAAKELVDTSKELKDLTSSMIPELMNELTQVKNLQEAWSAYANSISSTISALEQLLYTMQKQTLTYDPTVDYSAKMIASAYLPGNESLIKQYGQQRNLKLADNPTLGSPVFTSQLEALLLRIMGLTDATKRNSLLQSLSAVQGVALEQLVAELSAKSFDTGGYTGKWNDNSGKLAFLHQKELVLNDSDTQNILEVAKIIDSINMNSLSDLVSSLNDNLLNVNGLNSISTTTNTSAPIIYADFPGVTNSNEIETAFSNIMLKASQYVDKK